jgi:hypothetical protein
MLFRNRFIVVKTKAKIFYASEVIEQLHFEEIYMNILIVEHINNKLYQGFFLSDRNQSPNYKELGARFR